MKKYLSLLSFVAIFFMGMQFSNAQSSNRQSPESIAKQKTYELHQLLDLSGEQQSGVYRALVDAEQNMSELVKMDATSKLRQNGIKTVNDRVLESFKKILTPEQFETYEKSTAKAKN